MAKFNPDVPHPSDPSYLSYSKGIDADKSMASLFSGIGNIFEGAVKGGVRLIESGISEELRDRVQPMEDQHIAGLEATANAVTGVPGRTAQLRQANELVETPNIPPSMDRMAQRVQSLEGARANGKISETYYLGSLNQVAKEFRSRYPGFRDYVDSEIKRITGRDPANAYISSLIGDINAIAGGRDKEHDQTMALIKQNIGLPGMADTRRQYMNGQITSADVFERVNRLTVTDYHHRRFEQGVQAENWNRQDAARNAEIDVGNELTKIATDKFDTLQVDVLGTSKKVSEAASDVMLGKQKLTDSQYQGLFEQVDRAQKQAAVEMLEFMNRPVKGPGGKVTSRRQLIGNEKADQTVAAAMRQWDLVKDALSNKDAGLAHHHANQVKRLVQDEKHNLLTHKDLGAATRLLEAVGQNPEFQKTITIDHITGGGTQHLKNYLDESKKRQGTQFGATPNNPNTLKGDIDKLNQAAVNNPTIASEAELNVTRDKILSMPTMLPDPVIEDEVKKNLVISAFHPNNKGILDNIVRDHTKPDGTQVKGRFQAFRRMTSPDITSEVFRLDKRYPGQGLAQMYTDWSESTYRSLFMKEIADFDDIVANKNHKVTWDDKNMRFEVEPAPGVARQWSSGVNAQDRRTLEAAKATIFRLNQGLSSMKTVAEHSGRNIEAYLLDTIVATRDLSKLEKVGNLPQFLMNAIVSSKMNKEKGEKHRKAWETEVLERK